jgi:outer membrane receptor for Fe3+-dicitrate
LPAEIRARYPNCRITLPDVGNVMVTLETVYTTEMTLLNAKTVMRVGYRFVRPSMAALSLVQRYMMKLERDKRSRD